MKLTLEHYGERETEIEAQKESEGERGRERGERGEEREEKG